MSDRVERFVYDDQIVRMFLLVTMLWGLVGMLVGLLIALQLVMPALNLQTSWLSFGRLRPLHTNAVIFAFAGNAISAGAYYSSQCLLKARMWSDALGRLHFWGWQAIIVAAAVTLPLGYSQNDTVPRHDVLLPAQAAERPVYSYRLSILHFWTLVFIYIWAGPHHHHYSALPAWASIQTTAWAAFRRRPSSAWCVTGRPPDPSSWSATG